MPSTDNEETLRAYSGMIGAFALLEDLMPDPLPRLCRTVLIMFMPDVPSYFGIPSVPAIPPNLSITLVEIDDIQPLSRFEVMLRRAQQQLCPGIVVILKVARDVGRDYRPRMGEQRMVLRQGFWVGDVECGAEKAVRGV